MRRKKIIGFILFFGFLVGGFRKLNFTKYLATKRMIVKVVGNATNKLVYRAGKIQRFFKKTVNKTLQTVTIPFKNKIKKDQNPVIQNPYKETIANVRVGGDVMSAEERNYIANRDASMRSSLEQFVGMKIPQQLPLPKVMISLSGGGARAMIVSYAFCRAMEVVGLLNTATHIATLSGSNWFLWPWLISGKSIEEYQEKLFSVLRHGIQVRSKSEVKNIIDLLLRSLAYNREVNIIDMYSGLLANLLFKGYGDNNDPQQVYMDDIVSRLKARDIPYPISSVLSVPQYWWFSITPHEIGSASLDAYVAQWGFSRQFYDGKSIGSKPYADRVSLPGFIAMSSAAIAFSLGDAYEFLFGSMEKNGPLKKIFKVLLYDSALSKLRAIYSEEFNFVKGIENLPAHDEKRSWSDFRTLYFADAGVVMGNPIPVLAERADELKNKGNDGPTFYLICDGSQVIGNREMQKVKDYTNTNNPLNKVYSFPEITGNLSEDGVTILENKDTTAFYCPRIIDKKLIEKMKDKQWAQEYIKHQKYDMDSRLKFYYTTFKFLYTKEHTKDLIATIMFNIFASIEQIRFAMQRKIEKYIISRGYQVERIPTRKIEIPTVI